MTEQHSDLISVMCALLSLWLGAIALWWVGLIHAVSYVEFQADLPTPTWWALASAALGTPLVISTVLSVMLIYSLARGGRATMLIAIIGLSLAMVYFAIAMWAITLPMLSMCGDFVPDWPEPFQYFEDRWNGFGGRGSDDLKC